MEREYGSSSLFNFFQIISYITDYYSKDDSGTIEYLKKAKKDMMGMNMAQQLKQMANVFLSHRRMGEAEAIYRGMPDMHLSVSRLPVCFCRLLLLGQRCMSIY